MSIPHVLLGLLEPHPSHGYTLKASYDERFGRGRELRFGQVYATLARLQREGWAQEVAVEPGAGPERRTYAVTPAGVEELESWLVRPEPPTTYAHGVLFAKTVLAMVSGRSAADVLDAQRAVHVQRMREVTREAAGADVLTKLSADFELAHLQADLSWIETAGERLAREGAAVSRVLEARGVSVSLGGTPVLREVSLTLDAGEAVAIMGSSGSGKSTLLHCLAGLLRPDGGEVVVDGVPLAGLGDRARSRLRLQRLGFVPQFGDLVPELTLAENVELPLRLLGAGRRQARARALELLERLGVAATGSRRAGEASGGQVQRVAVARALAHRPAFVLADEPTGSLDTVTGETVLEALLEHTRAEGAGLLLVTHEARVAAHADREVVMRDGALRDLQLTAGSPPSRRGERRGERADVVTTCWLAWRLAIAGGRARALLVAAGSALATAVLLVAVAVPASLAHPLDDDQRRLVAVAVLVLALPVIALVAAVTRLSSGVRDRRLAALRVLGVDALGTRAVAAAEALILAAVGVAAGAVAFLAVRPAVRALDGHWGGWLRGSSLWPSPGGWAAATLGLLAVGVVVALAPTRTITAHPLQVRRQAASARPTAWRLAPLGAGVLLLTWSATHPLRRDIAAPDSVFVTFFAGTALAALGIPLATPVAVRRLGDGLARWAPTPSTQIAARRLQQEPAASTRLVAALLVGVFVVAGARCVITAAESVPQYVDAERAMTTGPQWVSLFTDGNDNGPIGAADAEALRAVPGVRAITARSDAELTCPAGEFAQHTGPSCGSVLAATCQELPALPIDVRGCVEGRPTWIVDTQDTLAKVDLTAPPTLVAETDTGAPDVAVPPLTLAAVDARLELRQDPKDPNRSASGTVLLLPPTTPGLARYLQPPRWSAELDGGPAALTRLTTAAHARGLTVFDGSDLAGYQQTRGYRALLWALAATVLGLGLLALLITGIDRAIERRRHLAALSVVGVPLGVVRRSQVLQAAAPLLVGLPLSAGAGLLAGGAYLHFAGVHFADGSAAAPWPSVVLVTAVALVAGLLVAAATVLGLGAAVRPSDLRRE